MYQYKDLYILILDKLRYERKITVQAFCVGICDRTQYYKFLKNRNIPIDILDAFTQRLNLTLPEFVDLTHKTADHEFIFSQTLLEAVQNRKVDEIKKLLKTFGKKDLVNANSQTAYDYASLTIKMLENKNDKIFYENLMKLINLTPKKNPYHLSYVEICILYEMGLIELRMRLKNRTALPILQDFITNNHKINQFQKEQASILIPIYSLLVRMYVIDKKTKEGINMFIRAETYAKKRKSYFGLAHLFYYGWAIYLLSGNTAKALDQLKQCMLVLDLEEDKEMLDYYIKEVKKDAIEFKVSDSVKRILNQVG